VADDVDIAARTVANHVRDLAEGVTSGRPDGGAVDVEESVAGERDTDRATRTIKL
jgi:hypothetical protein